VSKKKNPGVYSRVREKLRVFSIVSDNRNCKGGSEVAQPRAAWHPSSEIIRKIGEQ